MNTRETAPDPVSTDRGGSTRCPHQDRTRHEIAARVLADVGAPAEAIVPLMARTIQNAFDRTGPIAQGDWTTVEAHLAALEERIPELVALYRALAEATPR